MEEIKSWVLNIASAAVLMVILDLLIPESRIRKFTRVHRPSNAIYNTGHTH